MGFASPLRRLHGMHRAWSLLALAFAVLFVLGGARNSFGVLLKPIVEDLGGGRFGLSGAIALGQVMLGVGYVAAGLAMDRFGPQRVIPVFALMHLAGNLLVARAEQLWEVYLGWGFLSALAFGIGVGPFLAIVTRWFHRHRGLALGITASAAQLGVVAFAPLASLMVGGPGWRWAFVILAIAPFVALMLATVFVRDRPQDAGLQPYGIESDAEGASTPPVRPVSFRAVVSIALRRKALLLLLGAYVAVNVGTGVVLFHLVSFGTDQGLSPGTAALLLSAMSGVSIAGRLAFGVLSERFPVERLFAMTIVVMGIGLAVLPALGGVAGYFLFASAFGFFLGGTVVFMPVMGRALFGEESLAGIVGILLFAVNFGSALGALLGGAFDVTGSYTLPFLVAASVVGLGALLTLPVRLSRAEPRDAT